MANVSLPAKSRKQWKRPRQVTTGRWVAFLVIDRTFSEDAYADKVFTAEADAAALDPRERSQAQFFAYGTIQQAKLLDYVIAEVGKRPLKKLDGPVLHALRLGAFQLLFADSVADHAAVDQTVALVRSTLGERAVAFTNAVMRRIQVDGQTIIDRLDPNVISDKATLLSVPEWILELMVKDFGEQGIAAIETQVKRSAESATYLRCNTLRSAIGDTAEQLQKTGIHTHPIPEPFGQLVPEMRAMRGATSALSNLIETGMIYPQSLSSALVTHVLDPQEGERILDMCAAPGGKSTHIAARMNGAGVVVANELHEARASQLRETVSTQGADEIIEVLCSDGRTLTANDSELFDRVLLDAPCSGLGVLGDKPDLRWKRSAEDIVELVQLQRELLTAAVAVLKPGGVLVYSTCTLAADENEHNVEWALENLPLVPTSLSEVLIGDLPTCNNGSAVHLWPRESGVDGFFIARLEKK